MKRNIQKLVCVAAVAICALGARAWEVIVPATNDAVSTTVMVVPPVYDPGASWAQLPVRCTSVTVTAGAFYRIGRQVIVAANAGAMTNGYSTTTVVSTNTLGVVSTNTTYAVDAITVPQTGLSDWDGTVRWHRVPSARSNIRLRVTVAAGTTVVLSNSSGDEWAYAATADDAGFGDFQGSLYAELTGDGSGTNSTVVAWGW